MTSNDERVQRYAKTIWETSRADEGTISATGANHVARAVMAVADEELAELRGQARQQTLALCLKVARVEAVMRCAATFCHCGGDRASVPTREIRAALDGDS